MRVLALDSTTPTGSVAVIDDTTLRVQLQGDATRSHAERLPGDLVRALDQAGLSSQDIDLFAVVAGPGSFTGLRIGIAAIQGLALVHGRRIVAVSALDALGDAASAGLAPGTLVAAWMDAHRREVFTALWRVDDRDRYGVDRLVEVDAPSVGDPRGVLARWEKAGTLPAAIAGDGASLYADLVAPCALVVPHPALAPIAARMAIARAAVGQAVDPAGVQPIYVRRPDAEVAREAAAGRARDTAGRSLGPA